MLKNAPHMFLDAVVDSNYLRGESKQTDLLGNPIYLHGVADENKGAPR